jgi:hemoglobin/transferrin/lactoferrin receptor protein
LPFQVAALLTNGFSKFSKYCRCLIQAHYLFKNRNKVAGVHPFAALRPVGFCCYGVRMNNLIFRAGHLQNVITVDESMLDNVGIFFGPASTLFGSDALGGADNDYQKKAKF